MYYIKEWVGVIDGTEWTIRYTYERKQGIITKYPSWNKAMIKVDKESISDEVRKIINDRILEEITMKQGVKSWKII